MKSKFKIYIVHYDRLIDRKANLEKVLIQQDLEYEFISLYDRDNLSNENLARFTSMEKPNIANFLSHLEIYKNLIKNKQNYCLVLEDDSIPVSKFNSKIRKYLNKLPSDFDLFYISPGKGNFHIPLSSRKPFKHVYKKENKKTEWGGHGGTRFADGYFISNKCANVLVNEFNNNQISESIDWWKNKMIEKYELEVYWAEPTLIKTNLYATSIPYDK